MPLAIDVVQQGTISNASLALTRLAPALQDNQQWGAHLTRIANGSDVSPRGYQDYCDRMQARTATGPKNRSVLLARALSPTICGMGERTPGENGLTLHPVYGVPYIPGTSLKGILRSWVLSQDWGSEWRDGGAAFASLFGMGGHDGAAGVVDILDALPVAPLAKGQRFLSVDVLTPHVAKYYQGVRPPDGWEGPNPVLFLVASASLSYRIVVEGQPSWVGKISEWLELALRERGVGAKSRAGYGRFECSKDDPTQRLDARLRGIGKDAVRGEAEKWLTGNPVGTSFQADFAAPQLVSVLQVLDNDWGLRKGWADRAANPKADEAKRARGRQLVSAWDQRMPQREAAAPPTEQLAPTSAAPVVVPSPPSSPYGTAAWNPPNVKKGKERETCQKVAARLERIVGTPEALTEAGVRTALDWLSENGAMAEQINRVRTAYELLEG